MEIERKVKMASDGISWQLENNPGQVVSYDRVNETITLKFSDEDDYQNFMTQPIEG